MLTISTNETMICIITTKTMYIVNKLKKNDAETHAVCDCTYAEMIQSFA